MTEVEAKLRISAHSQLNKILGMSPPLDGLLSALNRGRYLDMMKLDQMLKTKHRGDYKSDESMKDFVGRTYGQKAVEHIEILI